MEVWNRLPVALRALREDLPPRLQMEVLGAKSFEDLLWILLSYVRELPRDAEDMRDRLLKFRSNFISSMEDDYGIPQAEAEDLLKQLDDILD